MSLSKCPYKPLLSKWTCAHRLFLMGLLSSRRSPFPDTSLPLTRPWGQSYLPLAPTSLQSLISKTHYQQTPPSHSNSKMYPDLTPEPHQWPSMRLCSSSRENGKGWVLPVPSSFTQQFPEQSVLVGSWHPSNERKSDKLLCILCLSGRQTNSMYICSRYNVCDVT